MSVFKKRKEAGNPEAKVDKPLSKLKRKELLEIMLAQGREIDRLREQNAELEAK